MFCLNCHQPLELDSSLLEKYPEWESLNSKVSGSRSSKKSLDSNESEKTHLNTGVDSQKPANHPSDEPTSFPSDVSIISASSDPASQANLGNFVVATGNLFDLISSSETALDHPLCQASARKLKPTSFSANILNLLLGCLLWECTNKLLDCMDAQLHQLEEECDEYKKLLDNLNQCDKELDMSFLKKELDRLQSEESGLKTELARLETEEDSLEKQLTEEEKKLNDVQSQESSLWSQYRDSTRQILELEQDQNSINNALRVAEEQLNKLAKTNVFNLAFHIWHSGHFGTINGFRLGRLPNVTVEWTEINGAWGQTVLLLDALARKIELKFDKYELVPYGNHSYIRCLEDGRELPLFCTGGYKFFWDTRFDAAMVAFLDCLTQLKEKIAAGDSGFCLPYQMKKDKIIIEDAGNYNEYSVKIQFNSEERWTKAMKFMLTNLKWALCWSLSQT